MAFSMCFLVNIKNNPYPDANIVHKMSSVITSAANIQMHSRLILSWKQTS